MTDTIESEIERAFNPERSFKTATVSFVIGLDLVYEKWTNWERPWHR